jgi:(1->4)-alpha-D-glucan 1-alpha-D-glucosylmutase
MHTRRTPSSTYRLQFNSSFTFEDASGIIDYLVDLGVSHVYASPYLQTAPGSSHGYDVADFKAVNQELGGAAAQEEFSRRVKASGLGQLLDIVPNHMSITQNNPYWRDVLENGRASRYADYFDMDWEAHEERLRNKVLLPVLGDQYGLVLASGGISLARNGARFEVICDAARLPVAPSSMAAILATAAESLHSETLGFIADAMGDLDKRPADDNVATLRTQRDRTVLLNLLTRYLSEKPEVLSTIDEAIAAINDDKDKLDEFLQKQYYRLAYWTSANQDLGYRRFFDIDSLIGVRVEQYSVFLDTHELIL